MYFYAEAFTENAKKGAVAPLRNIGVEQKISEVAKKDFTYAKKLQNT